MPPWSRDVPDPLKARRRQLADQEKELAERMSRLTQELRDGASATRKMAEPPVWRTEDEHPAMRTPELTPARRRDLARQRRRDKILFFLCIGGLVVAMLILFWVYQTHLRATE